MNNNCLAGIRCPKCQQEDNFKIEVVTTLDFTDDGTGDHQDADWGDESTIECPCGHSGKGAAFRVEYWPIDAEYPIMVGEELYYTDPDSADGEEGSTGLYTVVKAPSDPLSLLDDEVYGDCVITLTNDAGSELEAYPHELSRRSNTAAPKTNTYTAICQQSNGCGTYWMQEIEVDQQENNDDEIELAKLLARRLCATDWYGPDAVADDADFIDDITCRGLIAGNVDIPYWNNTDIQHG